MSALGGARHVAEHVVCCLCGHEHAQIGLFSSGDADNGEAVGDLLGLAGST